MNSVVGLEQHLYKYYVGVLVGNEVGEHKYIHYAASGTMAQQRDT